MKKIIIVFFIIIYNSLVYAAGSVDVDKKERKDTASDGAKAVTKFDIGKKLILKAKKLEKKIKMLRLKKTIKRQLNTY